MPLLAQAGLMTMGLLQQVRALLRKRRPSKATGPLGQTIRAASDESSPARRYGVALPDVERLTGLPAAELMLQFESLGDNCEFGLVQRGCGAEPLGLLRFSYIELKHLMRALESGFADIGEPGNMEVVVRDIPPRREYIVRDRKYELEFHTFHYEEDAIAAPLVAPYSARFAFLRRKLQEDLAAGEKILVLKRHPAPTDEEIATMHRLLQRHGRNTLLVVLPGEGQVPGTVEEIQPGLLRAYIDRFAPLNNASDLSFEIWLSICVRAYLLNRRRQEASS